MIKEIELSRIHRGTNIRNEKETDLQELAQSIEAVGLIHAIKVQSIGNGQYEIIAGHRRYEAMKLLGKPFITCDIVEEPLTFKERLSIQVQENVQRKNMSAVELVEVFDKCKEKGMTIKGIATFFNRSPDWVYLQYEALRILARDYGEAIPEEKKKQSAAVIKAAAKRRIRGEDEQYSCRGFTVKKRGHTYMIYCSTFEAETELNEFIKDRRLSAGETDGTQSSQ